MRSKLLFIILGLAILLGGLHYLASELYFYWFISWFDNLMHFLGGLTIGLLSLWICFISGIFPRATPTKKEAIITSMAAVLVIGIGWEIFEFVNGLTQSTEGYPLDTFHDLISDLAGAVIAGDLGSRKKFFIHE